MSPRSGPEAERLEDYGHAIPSFADLRDAQPPEASTFSKDDFTGSDGDARGFVVIIPAVLSNPSVEKNIAAIMERYASRFQIPECFVEGAAGDSDFYHWEALPLERLRQFCEWRLQLGYLVGPELFCVEYRDIPCDIYGVDDAELYRINYYMAGMLQGAAASQLARTGKAAFMRFMSRIDRAPSDFAAIARILSALLKHADLSDNGQPKLELRDLLNIAAHYSVPTDAVQDLPAALKELDGFAMRMRWLKFAWTVEESLGIQMNMLPLVRLHQLLALSSQAFKLELQPDTQPVVTAIGLAISGGELLNEARQLARGWGLGEGWLEAVQTSAEAWKLPNTFYYYAHQRSKAIAANMAKRMQTMHTSAGMVFSGGFHSHMVAAWLWENHRIKSVKVHPRITDLGEGIFYGVRIVAELRDWSYTKAVLFLTPSMLLKYGPIAYVRKLVKIGLAYLRVRAAKQSSATALGNYARSEVFQEAVRGLAPGSSVFVECGDLPTPIHHNSRVQIISADLFTYQVASEGAMPGQLWKWRSIECTVSNVAAVCCQRAYIPIRSSSIDQVIWLPRFYTIRAVDRVKAASELMRILRPGGSLRIYLRSGGQDTLMIESLRALGATIDRVEKWLVAQKPLAAASCHLVRPQPIGDPIVRVRVLPGDHAQIGKKLTALCAEYRITNFCRPTPISGLHEDLADEHLGLQRPSAVEAIALLRKDLEAGTREATLTVLVADLPLLVLIGGVDALREVVNAVREVASRIFVLVEAMDDGKGLGTRAHFCTEIDSALRTDANTIAQSIKAAILPLSSPGFVPRIPAMLLKYLACPFCQEHPALSIQAGFDPPRYSEGVLLCPACKTGFHIRNGVPETTSLAEMRGAD